jgi:hypothetical protein
VQTIVSLRKYLPHLTEEERQEETKRFEAGVIPTAERLMSEVRLVLSILLQTSSCARKIWH